MRRTTSALVLIGLLASTVLFNGCGRKEAESEGCPTGSFVANDTDTLTGPADSTFTVSSSFGFPSSGGTVLISPLTYTVIDTAGAPRNKICITLYTGGSTGGNGFWYSDSTYHTVVNGSGAFNKIVAETDDSGRATLYWSSENLPPANPVVSSVTGTTTTYTAGKDQTGTSFVTAFSGIHETTFNLNWTVQGEPGP